MKLLTSQNFYGTSLRNLNLSENLFYFFLRRMIYQVHLI